jgi:hypothetical protein
MYRKAKYTFAYGDKLITLQIGEISHELLKIYAETGLSSGVFITAHNPFGREQNSQDNEAANEHLLAELKNLASFVADGEWADTSGAWPIEKSYFALGVSLETARHLGRRYQQDGVVWTGSDALVHLELLR